jgi:hypothetical protein
MDYSSSCLDVAVENHENLRIAAILAEVRASHPPNRNQKRCYLTQLLSSLSSARTEGKLHSLKKLALEGGGYARFLRRARRDCCFAYTVK